MQKSTSTVPSEVLNQRIQSFADAVGIPFDKVKESLKVLGIDDSSEQNIERSLTLLENRDYLSFSDLCEIFVDTKIIAKPLLRLGIPHLMGSVEIPKEEETLVSTLNKLVENSKTIDKMSDKELLEEYDERDSKVAKELSERTNGRPFIVFKDDNTVDIEISMKILKIIKTNPKIINVYNIGDRLKKVYRAGWWPEKWLDESPFFVGEVLVDDYCERSDTSWKNINHEMRVLVRLHTKWNPSILENETSIKQVWDDSQKGIEHFRKKYKKAALSYDELLESESLPKLKLKPSQKKVDTAGM